MERKGGGGSGWGTHVNPWLIHVSVWQKPLQYCKVISLQLIKINGKKKITNVDMDVEKSESFCTVCRKAEMQIGAATMENNREVP